MKKNLLTLVFVLLTSSLALAQSYLGKNKNEKECNNKQLLTNNINFGLGYGIIAINANTTFQRLKAHKNIYSTRSVGLNYLNITLISDDHVFIPSLRFGIITGIDKKHHFEINAGPHLLVGIYNDGFDLATSELDFGFNIGYRKQKPQDPKVFKAGVGYPELLYVALGFSF